MNQTTEAALSYELSTLNDLISAVLLFRLGAQKGEGCVCALWDN
jgi:hypothetical protein